jgi:hypothetical protein
MRSVVPMGAGTKRTYPVIAVWRAAVTGPLQHQITFRHGQDSVAGTVAHKHKHW